MAKDRKAATKYIVDNLNAILPGCSDAPRYQAYLDGLSNADFEAYMRELQADTKFVTLTAPIGGKPDLSLERNVALADKLGLQLYSKLWVGATQDAPGYQTPIEYLVVQLPVRIASQRLVKKRSIPKTQRVVNMLTGQPTGESKGAGISHPELRVCMAMGLEKTMVELMKYRGGDQRGRGALNASLMKTGRANQEVLQHFASGVESTATLKSYLLSAGLKTTL